MTESNEKTIILLVDDEQEFLEVTARVLARRGFEVITASRGNEALNILKAKSVDTVVLDVKMPGMDGTETFGHIKKTHPGLPVIILTGHASISHAFDMSTAGVFHYMSKPCDMDQLADKCREAAQMRKARKAAAREAGESPISESGLVKVLLVDDEQDLLDTLQRVLRRRGMEVYVAESGEHGLKTISNAPIDIVILDVKLPGIDGLEVLRRIKQDHADVEAILLTGHPTVETAMEGIKQGAMEYLIKPPDVKVLTDLIRKAYAKRCEHLALKQRKVIEDILRRIPG